MNQISVSAEHYLAVDDDILKGRLHVDKDVLASYARDLQRHPYYAKMASVKSISMLHVDTLLLLRMLARATRCGILEIGPYIGGSTIALASSVRDGGGQPFVSIEHGGREEELGGEYKTHSTYPSVDILGDLRRNLAHEGLLDFVQIIEGRSDDNRVISDVFQSFDGQEIGLLFIDADGLVDRDMDLFRPLLAKDCYLVFDDYTAPLAEDKQNSVREVVTAEVASGRLISYGVFGWGTWFGRYRG